MAKAEIYFYEKDGFIWFHLKKPSTACANAIPFEFDGPATASHIRNYEGHYRKFIRSRDAKDNQETEIVNVEVEEPKQITEE